MSAPTIAILMMITITPFLSRFIKENTLICLGLFLIGATGTLPFFFQTFPAILCSRIGLGIGIGLMNPHAVSLVGRHFHGEIRQRLQGIRCSTETLGEACLIFLAGRLLTFGWQYAYLVYLTAFIILFLYLCFVPKEMSKESGIIHENSTKNRPFTKREMGILIENACLGFLLVASLTSVAMRISSFVVDAGFGNAVQASSVLSLSIISGFLGGVGFGKLLAHMKQLLLPASFFAMGTGLAIVAISNSLLVMGLGACLFGFFATIGLSYMFNSLSDHLSAEALTTANAVVLVGCNLGAATCPFLLQLFAFIDQSLSFGFLGYALIFLVIAPGLLFHKKTTSRNE